MILFSQFDVGVKMSDQPASTPMTPQDRARLRRARIAQNMGNRMALVTGAVKADSFKEEIPEEIPVSHSNTSVSASNVPQETSTSTTETQSPASTTPTTTTAVPTPSAPADTHTEAPKADTPAAESHSTPTETVPVAPSTPQRPVEKKTPTPAPVERTAVSPSTATAAPAVSTQRFPPTVPAPAASPVDVDAPPPMSAEETSSKMAFYARRKVMKRVEPIMRFLLLTALSVFVGIYSFLADPSQTHPFVQYTAETCPLIVRHPVAFFFLSYVIMELLPIVVKKAYIGRTPSSSQANLPKVSDAEALAGILPKGAANLMGVSKHCSHICVGESLSFYHRITSLDPVFCLHAIMYHISYILSICLSFFNSRTRCSPYSPTPSTWATTLQYRAASSACTAASLGLSRCRSS